MEYLGVTQPPTLHLSCIFPGPDFHSRSFSRPLWCLAARPTYLRHKTPVTGNALAQQSRHTETYSISYHESGFPPYDKVEAKHNMFFFVSAPHVLRLWFIAVAMPMI